MDEKPVTAQLPPDAQHFVAPTPVAMTDKGPVYSQQQAPGCYITPRRPTYG